MADFELDAMLEIDDSQVEDVNNELEAGVADGAAEPTPAQRDQQESIVAGGVSKGLLAAGVFGGILSQLKSVGGLIQGVLGAISRALLPTVEVIADLLRPVVSFVNDFISDPGQAVQSRTGIPIGRFTDPVTEQQRQQIQATGAATTAGGGPGTGLGFATGAMFNLQTAFLDSLFGNQSTDQSGEAQKQSAKDKMDDALRDITGGFK